AHGDHRRHRHARRRDAGRGGVHPAPEPGVVLHRALDADPRPHLRAARAVRARRHRGHAPRARGAPRVTEAPLLALDRLSRHFGALAAVNAVTLSIAARERRALIGPNGAGKTTLFNLSTVIAGHRAPRGGRVLLGGEAVGGLAPHAIARRGLSRSFQRNNLFPRLTVLENLRLAAAADGRGSWSLLCGARRPGPALARARETADAVGLAERLDVAA